MRRFKLLVVGLLVLGALVPAVALAAASPSVTTGPATHITQNSAELTGSVNPNGAKTGYSFAYGTSPALGATTAAKRAGRGTKAVAAKQELHGLVPGTKYYYRLDALSTKGGASGQIKAFTTAGPPPPGAVTGTATSVGVSSAVINGTIETNGATTTWQVQYGTTPALGLSTVSGIVAKSATPVPVHMSLSGLAPLTTFYYRIAAYHGSHVIGAGQTESFLTKPAKRLAPHLRTRTLPARDRKSPFRFTTYGALKGNANIPVSLRCTGRATINYYRGKIRTAHAVVPVQPNCTFDASVSFRHKHGKGVVPVTIKIHYEGNGYLAGAKKVNHVKIGHK